MSDFKELNYPLGDDFFPQSRDLQPLFFETSTLLLRLEVDPLRIFAKVDTLLLIQSYEDALLLEIKAKLLLAVLY